MIIKEDDYLAHYGILRRSGRYPWGSGGTQSARNKTFLDTIEEMRSKGMSETDIARAFSTPEHPFTTTMLRAARSIATNEQRQAKIGMAQRLKDKGWSNVAIAERMGINESSVRSLLAPGQEDRTNILRTTASMLKRQVEEKGMVDIGTGVENHLGISQTRLSTAVAMLREEGYAVHRVKIEQLGTGQMTDLKVLAKPGTTQSDVFRNRHGIKSITEFSDDGGRNFFGLQDPLSVSSKRVHVRYAEEGGGDADGVIYVRPGVPDISLGKSRYAQVRIAVDGTHYLKGMAMYKDDLPHGVDLMFNTSKKSTGNDLDAMKRLKDDPDNPFGSVVRQLVERDEHGKVRVTSAMNIVNEEGNWDKWAKNLSTQVLSKQSRILAKTQLDMTFERKKQDLDEILALTNPAVRKKLLEALADGADRAAVHLKAAHLPRQRSHVILPINTLKESEIYAPNYKNGERVVLVRFPHGGTFEIPELTVNNNHPEAKRLLGRAPDAVGINAKVAKRLSGADFDGDTVLVIPNNAGRVKTTPPLAGLKDFDPIASYPAYEGMKPISPRTKQVQMGVVSNLITDMTIHGASPAELARAVRHSMVVIDAEKHNLNYKQSAIDNGIAQLKEKYQGGARKGAATLISRKKSEMEVPDRKPRSAANGGPIDRTTGKLVFESTGATRTKNGRTEPKMIRVSKLGEAHDASSLSSGTVIEKIYADHSNRLKELANRARLEMVHTKTIPYSPSAKGVYSNEVASLNAKLNLALRNAPLERHAQILANSVVAQKRQANPDMDVAEIKRLKAQALAEARTRTGARKQNVDISPSEWDAIQAGAISHNKLTQILNNTDLDKIKKLATPKTEILMTSAKTSRAKAMVASGYTQAEIAEALGVSLTTLKTALA